MTIADPPDPRLVISLDDYRALRDEHRQLVRAARRLMAACGVLESDGDEALEEAMRALREVLGAADAP